VLVEGDGPTPRIPAVQFQARNSNGTVVNTTTNPNEPGILTVPDGEHTITLRTVPAGYTLKSIMYGDVDLLKQPLKIDGPVTWEIIIRLVKG